MAGAATRERRLFARPSVTVTRTVAFARGVAWTELAEDRWRRLAGAFTFEPRPA